MTDKKKLREAIDNGRKRGAKQRRIRQAAASAAKEQDK